MIFIAKDLHIPKICCTFAASKVNVSIMVQTQPTLHTVLSMAYMLPLMEQKILISKVQDNLFDSVYPYEPTVEQKRRLREAHQQALAGDVISQEDAHQMMNDFVQSKMSVTI